MSHYKKIMIDRGIMQKELLGCVFRIDKRVDKSLLSKIVNDICLPTPKVLDCICKFAKCDVLDIYSVQEIDLLHKSNKNDSYTTLNSVNSSRKNKGGLSHGSCTYNLTVEINRDIAERVLNKKALQKLGYSNKTHCVQQLIYALDKKYQKILKKEQKAVKAGQTTLNG